MIATLGEERILGPVESMASEPTVEIRPGIFRPDWSVATRAAARRALHGRIAARAGLLDRWRHKLEADEDAVWRTTLQFYGACGQPPEFRDIADASGISPERVATILRTLQSHDLVALDQACEQIRLAYPFKELATRHRVELNGHTLHALCAIDALGVADMYGADVAISSPCAYCGETIHVRTITKGRGVQDFSPSGAVVWYDFAYDGSAASSCCPATAFFCSDQHLQHWLEAQTARREGIRLTMDEALEVSRAIFGPVLER
jgi:hypothetical protein